MIDLNQDIWILILRIVIAAGLGAVLGLERDIHGRAAGFRTHILVSTGAAVFTIISTHIAIIAPALIPGFTQVADPARIAAQVVTGIGFLGAGAIIKDGFTIRGITTASSLWVTAAIGMASGAGFITIATATTALALFVLFGLSWLEHYYQGVTYRDLILSVPVNTNIEKVVSLIDMKHLKVLSTDLTFDYEKDIAIIALSLRIPWKGDANTQIQKVLLRIKEAELPIKKAKWHNR